MLHRNEGGSLFHTTPQTPNCSEENLQSVRSWIRKIEQSTMSISSRLIAVEKRLSEGMYETGEHKNLTVCSSHGMKKKKTPMGLTTNLIPEISSLQDQLTGQQKDIQNCQEQLNLLQKGNTLLKEEIQKNQNTLVKINDQIKIMGERLDKQEPLTMRLGALKIPVEISGIIGGLIAFTIAILVLIDQKGILLSPFFLCFIGVILIVSAMMKMIRIHSSRNIPSYYVPSVSTTSFQLQPVQYKKEER